MPPLPVSVNAFVHPTDDPGATVLLLQIKAEQIKDVESPETAIYRLERPYRMFFAGVKGDAYADVSTGVWVDRHQLIVLDPQEYDYWIARGTNNPLNVWAERVVNFAQSQVAETIILRPPILDIDKEYKRYREAVRTATGTVDWFAGMEAAPPAQKATPQEIPIGSPRRYGVVPPIGRKDE